MRLCNRGDRGRNGWLCSTGKEIRFTVTLEGRACNRDPMKGQDRGDGGKKAMWHEGMGF